jgi:hypothetical protein
MLIGATGLIGSALAADMTGAEIKAFVSGKTVYLETTAVSATGTPGQGAVYLAEDGTGLYKTPTGAIGTENGTLKATRFAPIGRRGRTIRARAGTRPETPSQLSTPSAVRPGPKL